MQRAVFFGGIEMIGFAVFIDKERHVARHLPTNKVTSQNSMLVTRIDMIATERFLTQYCVINDVLLLSRRINRPHPGIRSEGV